MIKNEKGAMEIILIAVVVLIVAAAGVFIFMSNSDDEDASSDAATSEMMDTEESSEASEVADATPSSGDYTVQENLGELAPVCESQSFASGLTKTETGTATAVLSNAADAEEFEYDVVRLSSAYTPRFSSTEVDRVACVERTDTVAFENTCEINGTSFTHRGYTFDVTVYDAHTQEVLASGTANHSDDCPSIAAVGPDNTVDAVNLDGDAVAAIIESI